MVASSESNGHYGVPSFFLAKKGPFREENITSLMFAKLLLISARKGVIKC